MVSASQPAAAQAGTRAAAAGVTRRRVLMVEDDDAVAEPLAEGLERENFVVTRVRTGAEALAAEEHDLVLLDLGLPDCHGAVVCHALHRRSEVPIIVLTARGEEVDRVALLESGADDYVVKPFGLRELVARIHAVQRRTNAAFRRANEDVRIGGLEMNIRTRRVRLRGAPLHLTPKEFDLLERLAREPGTVVRREELLHDVWDEHWWGPTKTLDVHITSLRKKLGDPRWITVVRGRGFRLEPQK